MSGPGVDLIQVDLGQEGFPIIEGYSFGEEVSKLDPNLVHTLLPFSACLPEKGPKKDSLQKTLFLPSLEQHLCTADSFQFRSRWYQLTYSYFDDGYIGGRPNQVESSIHLEEVGLIFSYANFMNGHSAMLISHQDTFKNALLQAAYDRLDDTSMIHYPAEEFPSTFAMPFDVCLPALESRWLSSKYGLKLASYSSVDSSWTVKYSATIYNPTRYGYYILGRTNIAPARAQIKFPESNRDHEWNLLETHYGTHFHRLDSDVYIAPGDSVKFDWTFKRYHGCGNCESVDYQGFQVYGNMNLYTWFFTNSTYRKGQLFLPFVQREIH